MYLKEDAAQGQPHSDSDFPTLAPSVTAVEVARKVAPELGFEIEVIEGRRRKNRRAGGDFAGQSGCDLHRMAHRFWQMEKGSFPHIRIQEIPIMGITRENLDQWSFRFYACSRHAAVPGRRLVKKIFDGSPAEHPVETPEKLGCHQTNGSGRLGLRIPTKSGSWLTKL